MTSRNMPRSLILEKDGRANQSTIGADCFEGCIQVRLNILGCPSRTQASVSIVSEDVIVDMRNDISMSTLTSMWKSKRTSGYEIYF